MVAFVLQTIVFALHGRSYSLDSNLMFLYVVAYGALETIFVILVEHRKQKAPEGNCQLKEKKSSLKFWASLLEGAIHGLTIALVVTLTLPNARLAGGKLFPVEALHFSIYFLLLNVSVVRHLVSRGCAKAAVGVLGGASYVLLLGSPWVVTLSQASFLRTAGQMALIWTSYDSILMLLNVVVFCLACSLFISETRKKGVVSMVLEQMAKLRRENARTSRQLLERDIGHVELVKHLFVDEENIEESVQDLVSDHFDTN